MNFIQRIIFSTIGMAIYFGLFLVSKKCLGFETTVLFCFAFILVTLILIIKKS